MKKQLLACAAVGVVAVAIVAAVEFWPSTAGSATPGPSPSISLTSTDRIGRQEVYGFPEVANGRGWDFAIPVPDWPSTHVKDQATYTDQTGRLILQTDRVPLDQEDPVSGLKALAKATHDPGYRLISLAEHEPVGSYDAAEWDFTYQRDGGTRQVRLVDVGIGDVQITIRYDAPQPDFEANLGVLTEALKVDDPG